MKERIQKILAAAGVDSRRKIEDMIRQGRVSVNGRTVTDLPVMIDPETDKVVVDGETIELRSTRGRDNRRMYILLNKPKDVFSTNAAQGEQTRAIDLLPPGLPARVYPVGRLDSQSKGLLLLTNDGELTQKLTHPRYGVTKTYRAVVDGAITESTLETLQKGIWLADPRRGEGFKTPPCEIKIAKRARDKSILEITFRDGRNSEVRRMLAKVGHKLRDLTRIRFGPLTLAGLNPGQSRLLTPTEIKHLVEWTEHRKTQPRQQPPRPKFTPPVHARQPRPARPPRSPRPPRKTRST